MKLIPLTKGKFAKVDDVDYEWLNDLRWTYATGYARLRGQRSGKHLYMHHVVMMLPDTDRFNHIDHINRDKLDNRRSNLRICTAAQNAQNRPNRHKYLGVRKYNNSKWRAKIGKSSIYGFTNPHHAALVYDLWAIDLYGKDAHTNFDVINS